MANIFVFLSKDGNITPKKARKSRQMQFRDKTAYVGVFAIDEILRYRGSRIPGSPTLCPPGSKWLKLISKFWLFDPKIQNGSKRLKLISKWLKLISNSKWLKLISNSSQKFKMAQNGSNSSQNFDFLTQKFKMAQNGSNSSQIIQWSSGGYITIHFRGLRGLRRAQKPKFWLFDPKIQNGRFRPFSFSKVQKPYQWSQLG